MGLPFSFEATQADPRTRATPGRVPGRELPRRFTLISLFLTAFATVLTSLAMGQLVERYLLAETARTVRDRADRVLAPVLREAAPPASLDEV